jgi:protoporphyrinogen oxidase
VKGVSCRWAIIGGGILGMRLADLLAARGHRVDLFESSSELGGLAGVWRIGEVVWDKHYHVILRSDHHLLRLLAELELSEQIRWRRTRSALYAAGRLYPLSNGIDFLRLPLLGLFSKLRLAATILRASRIRNARMLENTPVASWLRRWSGAAAFELIWAPLLRAKLGEAYQFASAAFIQTAIARMYAARRTGAKVEEFGFVTDGYSRILSRFEQRLGAAGVRIRTGVAVGEIRPVSNRLAVVTRGGEHEEFDRAAVTVPASVAARICPCLSEQERELLQQIRYQGIICASLLTTAPLSDSYLTYIAEADIPFGAVVDMTALVGREPFRGACLAYLPRYLPPDHADFELPDAAIEERFLAGLARIYPGFRRP